jgi:hypothetical protein
MTAFTGRYYTEGDRIVIAVDVAWQPGWEDTEQVRLVGFDGDRLALRTGVQGHPAAPGRRYVGTFAWEREH